MIKNMLLAAFITIAPQGSFAQSADETALYILTGKSLGTLPLASFRVDFKDYLDRTLTTTVVKNGECKYTVIYKHQNQPVQELMWDFNQAGSSEITEMRNVDIFLQIKGEPKLYCYEKYESDRVTSAACTGDAPLNHRDFGDWDPKRTQKAFEYMKASYCRGRAF